MSTFSEVFGFELRYRLRQRSTWLYLIATAWFTWLMIEETLLGEARNAGTIHANAPALIAVAMSISSMFMLIVSAGLFGDAAARDIETRMHPFVFTSPIRKSGLLGGRFAAAFFINALIVAMVPAGLMFVETFRGGEPELFGPFRAVSYLQPYFVFALPTLLATGAVIFSLSALTGRSLAGYAAAILLFVGAAISEEIVAEQFRHPFVATVIEPFALTALSELAEYWTPFEKNTRLVPVTGALMWNRIGWSAISVALLALTGWRFRLDDDRRRRAKRATAIDDATPVAPAERILRPPITKDFGTKAAWINVVGVARRSLRDVFATRFAIVLVAFAIVFVLIGGWESAGVILDTPTWPMTYLVARDALGDAVILVLLMITIFTGELLWRERDARMHEITGTLPVPRWVPVLGKFAALAIALAIFEAILMACGIFLQSMQGYHDYEIALYAKILFGIQWFDYLLWAALAFFLHTVVKHKYAAHVVFVLLWIFSRAASFQFGIEDNLLVFAAAPRWSYSDISGFEPFIGPWLAFKVYWAAWAVLLLLIAAGIRRRGLASAVLAIAVTGGFVFYNTHVLNDFTTRDERADIRAGYERLYKRHERLPQPLITHCTLGVELHPERRVAEIRGTYVLKNESTRPISAVHVLIDDDVEARNIGFDRAARRVLDDTKHRYQIYNIERALQPGESMQMRFDIRYSSRGFTNAGAKAAVVRNGTYFNRSWMPYIGYQPELELSDREARAERGMVDRNRFPPMNDADALQFRGPIRDARWIFLDTTIGVPVGTTIGVPGEQLAIAPGSLRRTWNAGNRRYFRYVTDAPIQNNYEVLSAMYAVRRDRWNDVAIEVYYQPRHHYNIDRIVRAMKASLDYGTRNVGPYPHRVLRIVEFPRHAGTYARAYPTTIAFSEGFGFMAKPESGIDYPFLVAAHEVSHQWWGNQLRPAPVEGAPVLAETMAHYSAMMIAEKTLGRETVDRFRPMLLHKYLVGRQNRRSAEVPLLRSNEQQYIHYDKGALVMYALREYVGEERLNSALRRLFERHRSGEPPYPTTRELYADLQSVTPEPMRWLLEDLFEDITLWDLRAKEPRVERRRDGGYRVTFVVEAQKLKADAIGRDRTVPMNDWIDVGVFAGAGLREPLYLQKHRIRSGRQTIAVDIARSPTHVAIDPYAMLIERDPLERVDRDNVVEVPAVTR